MQKTTTHREQSRIFLAQAYEELAKGDLPQASEKGWGAASQMLKAIAQQRGWRHQSHQALRGTVNALLKETGDSELGSLFGSAGDLHTNFYENWNRAELTALQLENVERFVDKVEALLSATP